MAGKPHTTRLFCIHKLIASLHISVNVCIVKQSTERIAHLRRSVKFKRQDKMISNCHIVGPRNKFLSHFPREPVYSLLDFGGAGRI